MFIFEFEMTIFCSPPSDLNSLLNEETRFKLALKRYLNTHTHTHSTLLMCTYCLEISHPFEGYVRVNSLSTYVDTSLSSLICSHCAFLGFLI
jgi:hypothetical protein